MTIFALLMGLLGAMMMRATPLAVVISMFAVATAVLLVSEVKLIGLTGRRAAKGHAFSLMLSGYIGGLTLILVQRNAITVGILAGVFGLVAVVLEWRRERRVLVPEKAR